MRLLIWIWQYDLDSSKSSNWCDFGSLFSSHSRVLASIIQTPEFWIRQSSSRPPCWQSRLRVTQPVSQHGEQFRLSESLIVGREQHVNQKHSGDTVGPLKSWRKKKNLRNDQGLTFLLSTSYYWPLLQQLVNNCHARYDCWYVADLYFF